MAAYIIAILERTKDPAEMAEYLRKVPGSLRAGMRPLAGYGALEVLEGPAAEGAVIIEFATMAEARAWYESPVYQDSKTHRLAGGEYRMMIVDGLS